MAHPDVLALLLALFDETATITAIANDGAGGALQITTAAAHGLTTGDSFQTSGTGVSELNVDTLTVASAPTTTTLITSEVVAGGPFSAATGSVQPYDGSHHSLGVNLFMGLPEQAGIEQIFTKSDNPRLSVAHVYTDGGPPPQMNFASTPEGWWFSGFELQVKSAPRQYRSGLAAAQRLHRLLLAASPGGILRTKLNSSEPELRAPNRHGQHVFITRGDAWYYT